MSSVLSSTFGGLLNSLVGATGANGSANSGARRDGLSLGRINFVERLESARKISRKEEEEVFRKDSLEWRKQLSTSSGKDSAVYEILCRALTAISRGNYNSDFIIPAIKLTQSVELMHKKIGYLYISQTLSPKSDLAVLMINTIHRDLSSPVALQISMGLNLMSLIASQNLSSTLLNALSICLSNQQPYVRKQAAIASSSLLPYTSEAEIVELLLPRLSHLESDNDPSVAIAAVIALSSIYKAFKCRCAISGNNDLPDSSMSSHLSGLRQKISSGASHILLQASGGALPRDYNLNQTNAPFVQVQMLKCIQCVAHQDWDVPQCVVSSVGAVFAQQWGGRDLTLYATLLEAVRVVAYLPLNDELVKKAIKVIGGFLRSSYPDFKYIGLKAIATIFNKIQNYLNESHLEAVVGCLESSDSLLQTKTLSLLTTMANDINYKAICATIMKYHSKDCSGTPHDRNLAMLDRISSIIARVNVDVEWCIQFFTPFLTPLSFCEQVADTLATVLINGIGQHSSEESRQIQASCTQLLDKILLFEDFISVYFRLICPVLNRLFELHSPCIKEGLVSLVLSKLERAPYSDIDTECLECIKNCGLYFAPFRDRSLNLLILLNSSMTDLDCKFEIQGHLHLLEDVETTIAITKKHDSIIAGKFPMDLTLSFLDSYVLNSLENGEVPYIYTSPVERTSIYASPVEKTSTAISIISKRNEFTMADNISVTSRSSYGKESCYSSGSVGCSQSSANTTVKGIWTPTGRIEQSSERSLPHECPGDDNMMGSPDVSYPVEVAQEAGEDITDEGPSENIEIEKSLLKKSLLQGLGLSKS